MGLMQPATLDLLAAALPPIAPRGWREIVACPACDCPARELLGEIFPPHDPEHTSAAHALAMIAVYACTCCGLVYKSPAPTRAHVGAIRARGARSGRGLKHDDKAALCRLMDLGGGRELDLLDPGVLDSDWLSLWAGHSFDCRGCAPDVVASTDRTVQHCGVFISGVLEKPMLAGGDKQYDVATLLYLLERVRRPAKALANLSTLVKRGGWLWVETDCCAEQWRSGGGGAMLAQHPYLIEHRVFWTRRSLERVAATHGFVLEHCEVARSVAAARRYRKTRNCIGGRAPARADPAAQWSTSEDTERRTPFTRCQLQAVFRRR